MGENRIMQDLYEENQRLKERIKELEEKHFSECGQIAHYDDELKAAKRLLKLAVTCLNDGGCTKDCDVCTNLEDCIRERHDNTFKWRYTDEALVLIGGAENDT